MDALSASILGAGLFFATAGLYHAGEKRSGIAGLKASSRARTMLRAISLAALAACLLHAAMLAGWEIAIPVWLALLGLAGTASLFVAAISPRWHPAAALCAGLLGAAGLVADALARL